MKKKNLILALLIPLVCSSCSTKQYPVSSYRTTMEFHDTFRVLQLADLHFGIETDLRMQLDLLTDAIEEANPDLILLTGDNFMYASKEIVNSLIDHLNSICSTRSNSGSFTKFAMTFGNHDNQGDYPRYYINDTLAKYASEDAFEIMSAFWISRECADVRSYSYTNWKQYGGRYLKDYEIVLVNLFK